LSLFSFCYFLNLGLRLLLELRLLLRLRLLSAFFDCEVDEDGDDCTEFFDESDKDFFFFGSGLRLLDGLCFFLAGERECDLDLLRLVGLRLAGNGGEFLLPP